MKKISILFFTLLFVLSPKLAFAHTGLSSSNPTPNQVVKEELSEIKLTYEGTIEEMSTMTLTKDGDEIPMTVKVEGVDMIGTLSNALENGTYEISWTVTGHDGHPITGEIPFSVEVAEKESPAVVTQTNDEKETTANQSDEPTKDSNQNKWLITAGSAILLFVFTLVLLRRKNK